MARRRGARKIALETLYEHDVSGRPAAEILDRYRAEPSHPYAAVLVQGVGEHEAEIDELIARYAEDWTVSRMPPIDRFHSISSFAPNLMTQKSEFWLLP